MWLYIIISKILTTKIKRIHISSNKYCKRIHISSSEYYESCRDAIPNQDFKSVVSFELILFMYKNLVKSKITFTFVVDGETLR